MAGSEFVYVTYIRATPEQLWQALTAPEFTRRYWFATTQESEWKPGASWRILMPDGQPAASGEILEIDPGKRLVLTWLHKLSNEYDAEGYSRLTYAIEEKGAMTQLALRHEMDTSGSRFIQAVSSGWPMILSSLKSLLETGKSLEETSPPAPEA